MSDKDEEGKSAALKLAEEIQRRPLAAAAIAGGAAAAAAGAVIGASALARRNGARKWQAGQPGAGRRDHRLRPATRQAVTGQPRAPSRVTRRHGRFDPASI